MGQRLGGHFVPVMSLAIAPEKGRSRMYLMGAVLASSLPALRDSETIQGRLHQRRRAPEIRSPEPVHGRGEIHQSAQGSFTQDTQRARDPHAALSGDTAR